MRRLLSCPLVTPPDGAGARLSPCLLPPAAFSASLPSARSWGWGVATVPPQPAFSEVNQDDNHSWYANRD
jgi:hypothetical protein